MRGGVVFLWAAIATVVLVAAGIFGTLVITGQVTLTAQPTPVPAPEPVVTPIVDTTYEVLVSNASGQSGLATQVADSLVAAGWSQDLVVAGNAPAGTDFATTTVFYPLEADEGAALGLADLIGGAEIVQNADNVPADDPDTERDESRMLTVVLGTDRAAPAQ